MPGPLAGERGIPVQHFLGRPEAQGNGLVVPVKINVGPQQVAIRSTGDFGVHDGWSVHKGNVINARRGRGDFAGRNGAEAGVGDGRNPLRAGVHLEPESGAHFTGVDVDAWRAVLAQENLLAAGVPADKLTILVGGAVNDLLARGSDGAFQGWNFACLPQAPGSETSNHADGIDVNRDTLNGAGDVRLGPFSAEQVGLTLNIAYLSALRENVIEDGTDVQVTLSGRIPSGARQALFDQTGWRVREVYKTKKPVLQDHDTGTEYVGDYAGYLVPDHDDGFFERTEEGLFAPITPAVAESRRKQDGPGLNVHHHIYEYVAVPASVDNRGAPITVYEI